MDFKTSTLFALAGFALSGILITSASAADDGKALFTSKMCVTCHGDEGKKPILPSYPKLSGQNKDYLVAQNKMIKDGTRSGGGTAAMKAIVAALSEEDMEAIAEYLSAVE